ncbi:MAG TPA: hypothetical protein VMT23_04080 [Candidatus Binatia bacterium]|nr:hypothetical protein [Candidatus Binatia bacterium]
MEAAPSSGISDEGGGLTDEAWKDFPAAVELVQSAWQHLPEAQKQGHSPDDFFLKTHTNVGGHEFITLFFRAEDPKSGRGSAAKQLATRFSGNAHPADNRLKLDLGMILSIAEAVEELELKESLEKRRDKDNQSDT